jgi:hypothetical protein
MCINRYAHLVGGCRMAATAKVVSWMPTNAPSQ